MSAIDPTSNLMKASQRMTLSNTKLTSFNNVSLYHRPLKTACSRLVGVPYL